MRTATRPVTGYIVRGRYLLDLRTIFPEQDEAVVSTVRKCLTS
jgi:hypothetical protein